MNILIFPSWYPSPGNPLNGIFFRDQALALKKAGINIYVLVLNYIGGLRYSLKHLVFKTKRHYYNDNGINTYEISYINFFPKRFFPLFYYFYAGILFKNNFKYIEHSNKIQIDLIHIHSAIDAGLIYWASKVKKKYVITEHSTLYSEKRLSIFQKKYLQNVFSSANRIIAVGKGLRKDISIYTSRPIDIIFNMVSVDNCSVKKDMNKKLFRFFSLGMDAHRKGMDILLSAFCESEISTSAELIIAGLEQSEIALLENIKEKYDSKINIRLLNKLLREEAMYYMYNSDCFALPSRFETFGVVFIEAMYFGKPVIASITGGPDSYITAQTGLLVPTEDINATKKAMEQMFYNRNKYDDEHIKNYAIANFSEEVISKKLINIYEDVINKQDISI